MKISSLAASAIMVAILSGCSGHKGGNPHFDLRVNNQTIELLEDSLQVLIYQKLPRTLTGEYICTNYIHPLFNLVGESYTEEFPRDHPYHRGVFWAWHQFYAGGVRLGDGWTNDSLEQKVMKAGARVEEDRVVINTEVDWSSMVYGGHKPFMKELNEIVVHRLSNNTRKIDFEIKLQALVKDLKIGGSADQKGYGGFCIRFAPPDSLLFTSEGGPVQPQEMQVTTGPWMDFSGRFGLVPVLTGVTILVHPGNPGSHDNWILRQKGSMQNAVFPGSSLTEIPRNKPLVLKYRLIIHNGDAAGLNIPALIKEYAGN